MQEVIWLKLASSEEAAGSSGYANHDIALDDGDPGTTESI
jgi:hypothetical protein